MGHVPMCVVCGEKEVQIVVNSVGTGYCSAECEQIADAEEEAKYHGTYEIEYLYPLDNDK